jgi:hypothetical protein
MEPQSPPKRMTRARAAAKAGENTTVKPTRIVTAGARAKITRPTAPTVATKRKLRSEDVDDDNDELDCDQPPVVAKATRARGRPKKEVEPTEAPAPRAARGRPKKTVDVTQDAPRATRITRTKKTEDAGDATSEPVKRPVRERPASSAATKPLTKKRVTFDEPEKENIAPAAMSKRKTVGKAADTDGGLRGKPVRKASTATKSARTVSRPGTAEVKDRKAPLPLSPKKVTQIRMNRDVEESEDELGANDNIKPMMRSPVKPPRGVGGRSKQEAPASVPQEDSECPVVILGSPAKRPPPSPYKDTMKSPARRPDAAFLAVSKAKPETQQAASPFKVSLLQSPAKRPTHPITSSENGVTNDDTIRSPFKMSLLQSPAKRPIMPTKSTGSPQRSPAPKPTLLATPGPLLAGPAVDDAIVEQDLAAALGGLDQDKVLGSATRLQFPGRLSAVLPRHADPVVSTVPEAVEEEASEMMDDDVAFGEPMEVDAEAELTEGDRSTTPSQSPPKVVRGLFGLRQKDLHPYQDVDSESEDELAPRLGYFPRPSMAAVPATPCPAGASKTPRSQGRALFGSPSKLPVSNSKIGFTPLAEQLNGWGAASPQKPVVQQAHDDEAVYEDDSTLEDSIMEDAIVPPDPTRTTFFDEAIRTHVVIQETIEQAARHSECSSDSEDLVETPVFEDITVTKEDVALAAEANEMSLMEPHELEDMINVPSPDDTMSETSQEYGDENAIPIDPALLPPRSSNHVPAVTPQRVMTRTFHTTSKVPLKPADDSTPRQMRKRSHSISRLPTSVQQRPSRGLTRNATVISYSPSKKDRQATTFDDALAQTQSDAESRAGSVPATPSRPETSAWSTAGTPAHTPRRDVDPALLRGAIVFVDVHTTEGADASGIFVELLSQMGARCVKTWPWNPSSPPGKEGSSSKIGITHVVFKDGGKRTMEKVRNSNGVVQCVGVSWVLEWVLSRPKFSESRIY